MEELRGKPSDRRAHTRFALRPMYSAVEVKLSPDGTEALAGHAYDISRGGVCFELDRWLDPGTPVRLTLTLPEWLRGLSDGEADGASVSVQGTVVWADDDEVPGPVRMAAVFTSFDSVAERELFLRTLHGHTQIAAA